MSQKKARVFIEGTRPILFHKFNVESLTTERKAQGGSPGNDPEEWRRGCFVNEKKQLYMPGTYVFSAVCAGAVYTKVGRGTIQKKVVATMQVLDESVVFDRYMPDHLAKIKTCDLPLEPHNPVYLDVRGVRNPNSLGRNIRYRIACCPGWKCEFSIMWDSTIVSPSQMECVCRDCGSLVGLADARAIGYGRFKVTQFDVCDC
mgnify:CR=1 FL=1